MEKLYRALDREGDPTGEAKTLREWEDAINYRTGTEVVAWATSPGWASVSFEIDGRAGYQYLKEVGA